MSSGDQKMGTMIVNKTLSTDDLIMSVRVYVCVFQYTTNCKQNRREHYRVTLQLSPNTAVTVLLVGNFPTSTFTFLLILLLLLSNLVI